MENIKNIVKYSSFFELISDAAPDLLRVVSDEMKDALNGFDDYEGIIYYLINDETVLCADSCNGDISGDPMTIQEFFFRTVEYCVDFV